MALCTAARGKVNSTRFGGRAFLPEDPVLATSRGLYKMALMQAARKRARPARDGAEEATDG